MNLFNEYNIKLNKTLADCDWARVEQLCQKILSAWKNQQNVFICGNGGSAANAAHLANDLLYGASPGKQNGIKVNALSSHTSVLTCIANDLSYDEIFSYQLEVMGAEGDILIVFSGSGNSTNIIKALNAAKNLKMFSCAVTGFDGGKASSLADLSVCFPTDSMQIAEDCQQIMGHMITCWLKENNPWGIR